MPKHEASHATNDASPVHKTRTGTIPEQEEMTARGMPAAAFQRTVAAPPAALPPRDVLALQQSVGNQAVQRLLAARRAPATDATIQRVTLTPAMWKHISKGELNEKQELGFVMK